MGKFYARAHTQILSLCAYVLSGHLELTIPIKGQFQEVFQPSKSKGKCSLSHVFFSLSTMSRIVPADVCRSPSRLPPICQIGVTWGLVSSPARSPRSWRQLWCESGSGMCSFEVLQPLCSLTTTNPTDKRLCLPPGPASHLLLLF